MNALRKRPAIFGLGAVTRGSHDKAAPACVMLTTPEHNGERIRIGLYLTNGTLVFEGSAEARADVAQWSLRAVKRLGAFPIRASGSFSSGVLQIDVADSGTRIAQRARPQEIVATARSRVVTLRVTGDA
jgi:hypothetical protein